MRTILTIMWSSVLLTSWGQVELHTSGVVSYISAEHVYVRFSNTDLLQEGDTLYTRSGNPCLVVKNKSSISCITRPIGSCTPTLGDSVSHRSIKYPEVKEDQKIGVEQQVEHEIPETPPAVEPTGMFWKGSAGLSSMISQSMYSEDPRTNLRHVARLNLLGRNRSEEHPIEVCVNGNLQHYRSRREERPYEETARLNIYQAYVNYGINARWNARVGRFLQSGLSSAGVMDAGRVQFRTGSVSLEAVAGTRPELRSLQPNIRRPLLGLNGHYAQRLGRNHLSFGLGWYRLYEQGTLDRQSMVSQGSLILPDLSIFYMSELDLSSDAQRLRLQSIYLAANYRISKQWRAYVSYDTRLPVVYYSSYDTARVETLLEQEAQRGLRTRLSYRPARNLYIGLESTYRYSNSRSTMAMAGLSIRKNHLFTPSNSLYYRVAVADYGTWDNLQQILRFNQRFGGTELSLFYRHLMYSRWSEDRSLFHQSYFGLQTALDLTHRYSLSVSAEYDLHEQQNFARLYVSLFKRI